MPRFFFDIVDGEDFPDIQGSIHADLAAARIEAIRYSAEVLKEMPERFWNSELWTMSVFDQNRVPLFTLKFLAADAVVYETPRRPQLQPG
ncbi:hypothetical protein IAG41_07440 [Sphingomonas sp. JC676]|uniref:DUF6894 family protein n=1 Tax=Sphingomonas sp. JC676 TaxID=2768065 RepID=UPI00165867FE|nr:hypothetical protein [Sphingomonas sp. JC676]MBC9032219.1 hypothetical protein [Sphingomonas sp. JC676]